MRVQTGAINPKASLIFHTLEKLRLALQFDDNAWSDILGLTPKEYDRHYRPQCQSLPLLSFMKLCTRFSIDGDSLFNGTFDPLASAAHHMGDMTYIPERYMLGARSVRRSMRNVLKFTERQFGTETVVKAAKHLQVPLVALESINSPINLLFAVDLFENLKRSNVHDGFFKDLGQNSIISTKSLPFLRGLKKLSSSQDVYECYLAEHVHKIEKNCSYRISELTTDGFYFESLQNDELIEIFKNPTYGSRELCQFKVGSIGALPLYADMPAHNVRKTACIHEGDSRCEWFVHRQAKQRSSHIFVH